MKRPPERRRPPNFDKVMRRRLCGWYSVASPPCSKCRPSFAASDTLNGLWVVIGSTTQKVRCDSTDVGAFHLFDRQTPSSRAQSDRALSHCHSVVPSWYVCRSQTTRISAPASTVITSVSSLDTPRTVDNQLHGSCPFRLHGSCSR